MKTAVEWFVEQLSYTTTDGNIISHHQNITHLFEQAKAMEKDNTKKLLEIIMWYDEQSDVRPNTEIYTWFQQYYNETFKSE